MGQQKQVAKTTNTKYTDTNKEPPGATMFLLKGLAHVFDGRLYFACNIWVARQSLATSRCQSPS